MALRSAVDRVAGAQQADPLLNGAAGQGEEPDGPGRLVCAEPEAAEAREPGHRRRHCGPQPVQRQGGEGAVRAGEPKPYINPKPYSQPYRQPGHRRRHRGPQPVQRQRGEGALRAGEPKPYINPKPYSEPYPPEAGSQEYPAEFVVKVVHLSSGCQYSRVLKSTEC